MKRKSTWRSAPGRANCMAMVRMKQRSRFAPALALAAVGAASLWAHAGTAHASDPGDFVSEIITPAGWELHWTPQRCGWEPESRMSRELVIPDGWRDSRDNEPSWGGCMCSELVVPAEWARKGDR